MIKISVISGLLGGIACFLFFYILYLSGFNPLGTKLWDIWIPALTVIAAMYFYRRQQPDGGLHLWEGLIIGFLSYTILAAISGFSIYLFLKHLEPQLMEFYLQESRELMVQGKEFLTQKLGEEAYQQRFDQLNDLTYADMGWDEFWKKMLISFFMVPIVSMILRKPVFNTTT